MRSPMHSPVPCMGGLPAMCACSITCACLPCVLRQGMLCFPPQALQCGSPCSVFAGVPWPVQHRLPCSGFDCEPEWMMIGGLLFVPLMCPLADMEIEVQ